MKEFKERLWTEIKELVLKIENLEQFLERNEVNRIDSIQDSLLTIQLNAMLVYKTCLIERYKRYKRL